MKQGEENTEFVKNPEKDKQKYIFQKDKKTKIGAAIIIGFLILMIIGVIVSGVAFE
ncbi:hypothetical protein PP182_10040 [Maribacter sp. PR1]|uniref:Uncharacterized protein n=1 Tax=Maribacter cobaltidurans TaxID=1178778 RepID=A0ABU7IU32_9FLAO|nr:MULTISPECIES: hypothetical protein [Maribacter]MDC6389021.1 hypothetical protein [Maribacter sp. PR1]MEE1976409.1 hypothetical protein [Maribacter cobaltidurans]